MRVSNSAGCKAFPGAGAQHVNDLVPRPGAAPERVSILLISESVPADPTDYYG
jgi:hypothetical protein